MSLNLKPNHVLTIGAVLFAGFALYETFKKPGGQLSSQPGQAARDSGLQAFLNLQDFQSATHNSTTANQYLDLSLPSNFGGITP